MRNTKELIDQQKRSRTKNDLPTKRALVQKQVKNFTQEGKLALAEVHLSSVIFDN